MFRHFHIVCQMHIDTHVDSWKCIWLNDVHLQSLICINTVINLIELFIQLIYLVIIDHVVVVFALFYKMYIVLLL